MSDTTTNGTPSAAPVNGTPKRSRRRRFLEARRSHFEAVIALEEIRARESRRLVEHFMLWDEDWATSDLYQRTRGDYQHSLPSRPSDRRWGADWPLWRTETDLDRIRQKSRVVCAVNSYARGLLKNLTNHVIGKGFSYKIISKENTPDADPQQPGKQDGATLKKLIAQAQDVVDRFLERNRWNVVTSDLEDESPVTASREREIFRRVLRDGECFGRFYQIDGEEVWRFIEPEQVRQPPSATYAEGWSFGIRNRVMQDDDGSPLIDVETTEAYYVYWIDPTTISLIDNASFIGEEVEACNVLHIKGPDTDSTIKRGVPFFSFDVAASLERARVLQRNASIGAAVRSATAEIWKHTTGTQAEIQGFANKQREYSEDLTKQDGTAATDNYEWARAGMIRRIPEGQEPVFPAPDNTPQYLQGVQGDLRQACAAGCAPEYWTADASNGTYAGLKEAGAPAVKNGETEQAYYQAVFGKVVWRALRIAVKNGRLPEQALTLLDLQVEGPAVLQRDSLQKAQEDQIYVSMKALSQQTVMMERGRNPEVELANIQQFQDRFGDQGMPLGLPGDVSPGPQDDFGGALHDGGTGGAKAEPGTDPQAGVLQSQQGGNDPRTTVSVLTAVASLQSQFYAGKLPREAAIANVMLLFGFTSEEAASLFPEIAPQKLTPDDAGAGGGQGPPGQADDGAAESGETDQPDMSDDEIDALLADEEGGLTEAKDEAGHCHDDNGHWVKCNDPSAVKDSAAHHDTVATKLEQKHSKLRKATAKAKGEETKAKRAVASAKAGTQAHADAVKIHAEAKAKADRLSQATDRVGNRAGQARKQADNAKLDDKLKDKGKGKVNPKQAGDLADLLKGSPGMSPLSLVGRIAAMLGVEIKGVESKAPASGSGTLLLESEEANLFAGSRIVESVLEAKRAEVAARLGADVAATVVGAAARLLMESAA